VESLNPKTRPHCKHWQKRSWDLLTSELLMSPQTMMESMKVGLHLSAPPVQRVSSSHDVTQLPILTSLPQTLDLHQNIQSILILMRTLPFGGKWTLYVPQDPALQQLLTYKQTAPTIAAKYFGRTAPKALCDALDEYGDLLNTPSVGNTMQHYFSSVQVNISPAAKSQNDCECLKNKQPFYTINSNHSKCSCGCSWAVWTFSHWWKWFRRFTHQLHTHTKHSWWLQIWLFRLSRLHGLYWTHCNLPPFLHRSSFPWRDCTFTTTQCSSCSISISTRDCLLSKWKDNARWIKECSCPPLWFRG